MGGEGGEEVRGDAGRRGEEREGEWVGDMQEDDENMATYIILYNTV